MTSPCSPTTYWMAAKTCSAFHRNRVLPWCAHRFRSGFIKPPSIQTTAGISFEIVHDPLRRNLGLHHSVDVIASHMGREQTPATLTAHFLNRFQYGIATGLIQVIGSLIHTFPIGCGAR
jgi:hypothetical protein